MPVRGRWGRWALLCNLVAEKALARLQCNSIHEDHHADALRYLLQQQLHPNARQGVPHQRGVLKVIVEYHLLAPHRSSFCFR